MCTNYPMTAANRRNSWVITTISDYQWNETERKMTAARKTLLFLDRVSNVPREIKFYHVSSVRRRGKPRAGYARRSGTMVEIVQSGLSVMITVRRILFYVERNPSGRNPKKWESIDFHRLEFDEGAVNVFLVKS